MEEPEVVARCRKGDETAFTALFERFHLPAWRLAYTILGNRSWADDCVQEAFIHAFRAIGNVRPDAAFGPWFLTIVTRQARRMARRQRWRFWLPLAAMEQYADERAAAVIDAADLNSTVWHAVGALPVDLREAVALRYVLDMSEQQMAAILGVPAGTVKSRLHRARRALQARLTETWKDGELLWSPTN